MQIQFTINISNRFVAFLANRRARVLAAGAAAVVLVSAGVLAYAVTIPNSFTKDTTISSQQVNDNFAALKTAVDALEGSAWQKSGSNISYTAGNVGIGTGSPGNKLTISGGTLQLHASPTAPTTCDSSSGGAMYFDTQISGFSNRQDICSCWNDGDTNGTGVWKWTATNHTQCD